MSYRFEKDVNGIIFDGNTMAPSRLTVRGTADSKGKSLSIADDKIMLEIPLEPILKDIKKMMEI